MLVTVIVKLAGNSVDEGRGPDWTSYVSTETAKGRYRCAAVICTQGTKSVFLMVPFTADTNLGMQKAYKAISNVPVLVQKLSVVPRVPGYKREARNES
eukprot:3423485-Rhodomonas_salina.2